MHEMLRQRLRKKFGLTRRAVLLERASRFLLDCDAADGFTSLLRRLRTGSSTEPIDGNRLFVRIFRN